MSGLTSEATEALRAFFPGDSELARRMRQLDWTATDLGPPETWRENRRTAVSLCLTSRIPIVLYFGPAFTVLYNDPYISFLGPTKHPRFLGSPGAVCWREIWPTIGPMLQSVYDTGKATWSEDVLMFFARNLPLEEVYVRFTFGPLLAPDGRTVEGIFCPCTETTEQVVGARRLDTLRRLGARAPEARTVDAACKEMVAVFGENPRDIPFAGLYLLDGDHAVLSASAGLPAGHPLPESIGAHRSGGVIADALVRVLANHRREEVRDLERLPVQLPGGPWPEPATTAVALPIPGAAHDTIAGVLVIGVSSRRVLDPSYLTFFDLVAGQIGTALADATAYEAERKRAEALAELDRAKTAFFSNVSHEFRTPLTLMLGPLEDALRANGALAGESLDVTYRNALRLLRLVNALLDFSRIEAGRLQARFEPVDLARLTTDLVGVFRAAFERAGLRLNVTCPVLPEPVYVDREMWEKIVFNLLSNALKFTFEGGVDVDLRSDGNRAVLTVRDSGTGIAADQLPRVFERFHRIEGAQARTHEGSGIGLALIRELTRLHGGETAVDSTVGQGTTFTVSLPFGASHLPADKIGIRSSRSDTAALAASFVDDAWLWIPEAGDERATNPARTDGTRRESILVADDNADMRQYLVRLLSERWDVDAVGDGMAALEAARARRPALIVTDVMMPRLDGFGLIRELRADPDMRSIPVIMLSARAGEEARVGGIEAGANDYLVKPFSARELIARVTTRLDLQRVAAEASAANRAKDEFLAMLGHELRNPLSPITTSLQLMRLRGFESKEQALIERQIAHLTRLVDDLLDVSRVTRGKIELRKQPVEIADVVLRALEMASPLLEQQRHDIDIRVPRSGLVIDADIDRISQVISNLLTNAAKYSDGGSRIEIRGERHDSVVRVTVKDDGIGLAPDMVDRIFDVFVQQPQALDRARGGLGLGLTIVRSLVELHGGKVRVQSDGVGKGSAFIVELPASSASVDRGLRTPAPAASTASRKATGGDGHRILVVDDNHDAADSLAEALEELGYAVKVAHDGPAALTAAKSFRPHIALVDIGLPVMDGYELARRLKQTSDELKDLRLVAVTGYGLEADRRRSEEAGFARHLVKPVDLNVLHEVVTELQQAIDG
jgi:signal transduction histidine kinase